MSAPKAVDQRLPAISVYHKMLEMLRNTNKLDNVSAGEWKEAGVTPAAAAPACERGPALADRSVQMASLRYFTLSFDGQKVNLCIA